MIVAVVDGLGGGIGAQIISELKGTLPADVEIWALGTNAVATANMLKAGAQRGASGENALCYSLKSVDLITGPFGIVLANSMLGELTPKIAEVTASASALKVLLPIDICGVEIAGTKKEPLPNLIKRLAARIAAIVQNQ